MGKRRLKDIDAAERMFRAKALVWSLAVAVMGLAVVQLAGGSAGASPGTLMVMRIGVVVAATGVYFLVQAIVRQGASLAGQIYNPSGSSTPAKREYSYAESLVARARYEEAAPAYELYCIEYPEEPEAYFRLARLYRDHLGQFEDAISWFRRARSDAKLTPGQELLAIQEIIEIYLQKLGTPRKAIPELALLCEKFPDTPAGQAARRELTEMRELLAREDEGLATFTGEFLRRIRKVRPSNAGGQLRGELEGQMIEEALRESGGDRNRAAAQLGISVDALTDKIEELRIPEV